MEKILLAIDALEPNENALKFACYLGHLTKSKITAVFLENLQDEVRPVQKDLQGRAIMFSDREDAAANIARTARIEQNISAFKDQCLNSGVSFIVHRDRGLPARDLIKESRFADVLVIDAGTSFKKRFQDSPTGFARDILQKAECPVIISPERFEELNEIIFAYNGSASAAFAIKQFTYLFSQLQDKKVTILQVNETGEWHDPDKHRFNEWLKDHYTNLHFEAIKGKTDEGLFDLLFNRKNMFLVMGAYGRNALSRFFIGSHADPLIRSITQPIFIAHL
ncbi:MAG: universal stress protein [Bacteroidota bacterium]|nr:universal stress protein [Bacteroidota bacterium]